jgi:hypothetical protein
MCLDRKKTLKKTNKIIQYAWYVWISLKRDEVQSPASGSVVISVNPLAYTNGCEPFWATDVLLVILAFCR